MYGIVACEGSCYVGLVGVAAHSDRTRSIPCSFSRHRPPIRGAVYAQAGWAQKSKAQGRMSSSAFSLAETFSAVQES